MIRVKFRDGVPVKTGCLVLLAVLVLNLTIGGCCLQYTIETWASYAKGHTVDIPFWPCWVGGAFLGEIAVPAAVVTWLVSFVL